ncbi:MAG: uroporphyrinogen decarboxylase family protein [Anaerolineae bacterium]
MNARERVIRAIEFRGPDRVPVRYYDNPARGDILVGAYTTPTDWAEPQPGEDEWGCQWLTLTETLGQVKGHLLGGSSDTRDYRFPDPYLPGRLDALRRLRAEHPEYYVAGSLGISGFNRMTFLTGMECFMLDLCQDPERVAWLADGVFGFENGILEQMCALPLDGVWFWDDWGTQNGLMISPGTWREVFRPRYAEQFARIHAAGMHVIFHSCGHTAAILSDLAEIGADMLHLNQPRLIGIDRLAREVGGRACLHCPVDTQSTLIYGTPEEIRAEARELVEKLACYNGGFVACADEGWGHGSVSPETLALESECFLSYGAQPPAACAAVTPKEISRYGQS